MTPTVRPGPRLWIPVAAAVLVLAFVAAALGTDRPEFCATCHEMRPYNDAWATGSHKTVWCIDCHVEPGLPARFAHKFIALGEVKLHLLGDTKFPRAVPPDVPAERCTRCHTKLPVTTKSGFPHATHAKRGSCVECHATVAHRVTVAALKAVDAYSSGVTTSAPHITGTAFAAIDAGVANLPGHVSVSCARCHDLAKTGCARCHTPKHKPRGTCTNCHRPGPRFVFTHPVGRDCARCHAPSSKHFKTVRGPLPVCTACHRLGGASWKSSHPRLSDCRSCHRPPGAHPAGQCSACHRKVGVSFAFAHPSAGEHSWRSIPCARCHPRSYAAASCTCHGGRAPSGD